MKIFFIRMVNMVFGLILYAFGIIITINANIGYAPWDVFHMGIVNTTGLTLGIISIAVGLIILLLAKLMGEKIGLGTISNIVLIGLFIDIINKIDFIPFMDNLTMGIVMLIIGLVTISLGTYFYIKAGFGAGPRDNLMVMLARKTKIPVGVCRSIIELTVTLIGWLLGGMAGVGTIISVIGIGLCVQITFRVFKFDVTAIKHESLGDSYKNLRQLYSSNRKQ